MNSYPIWNSVEACIYKSSKDWGAKNDSSVNVYVGQGARNSHLLGNFCTTRREVRSLRYPGEYVTVFSTSFNGVVLARMWFRRHKSGKLYDSPYKVRKKKGLKSIPSVDK